MTQVKDGDTVRIHYTGRLADGTQFDSSEGRDPLEFRLGSGNIIPGLEAGIAGMKVGDKATVEIAAADAYGPYHAEGVREVPRSSIPGSEQIEVGAKLKGTAPDGQEMMLVVSAVGDDTVTIDANHPLAGKDLVFDVELVGIGCGPKCGCSDH